MFNNKGHICCCKLASLDFITTLFCEYYFTFFLADTRVSILRLITAKLCKKCFYRPVPCHPFHLAMKTKSYFAICCRPRHYTHNDVFVLQNLWPLDSSKRSFASHCLWNHRICETELIFVVWDTFILKITFTIELKQKSIYISISFLFKFWAIYREKMFGWKNPI